MNELEQIKKMLINIENLNEENRNFLKKKLLCFGVIDTKDTLVDIYNLLNSNQLELLINLLGVEKITENFVLKIDNKKNLPVIPYDFNSSFYYYQNIFKNVEASKTILSNENFYSKIDVLDINSILTYLEKEELKILFIDKCLSYKTDILLDHLKFNDNKIAKYISNNKIIELMQSQSDSDSILNLYRFLDDKNKIDVYNSDWFRNKIDINHFYNKIIIMENSPNELIEEIAKKNNNLDPLHLLDMFKNNRRVIFLKLFLDKITISELDDYSLERTIEILFLINNKHWNELENHQQKIVNLINNIPYDIYINQYCDKYRSFDQQSLELKNIMYDKATKILEKNDIKLSKISPHIYKKNDMLALNLIKDHLTEEDLLLLSIRNEYLNNYTLELLKNKPDFFKDIEIKDISKYPVFNNKISEELFKKFLSIANYLDKEQLKIFFIPFYIENSSEIRNYYIYEVTKNPNLLSSLKDLNFFDEDISKNTLLTMNINKLMKLLLVGPLKLNENIKNILSEVIYKRIIDISTFINNEDNHSFICKAPSLNLLFRFLEKEKQQEFISLINNYSFLCRYLIDGTSQTKDIIIERLINLYNNDIEIDFMTDTPLFFKDEDQINFFDKLSFPIVINMACNSLKYSDLNNKEYKKYIKYITSKIDKNFNALFDINIIIKLEELLIYLPIDYQEKIKSYIDNKYNILKNKYPLLTEQIITYTEKANYILSIENEYINDATYNYVLDLLSKNKYLFNSMDFRLLIPNIMKMGNYFVDKTSRHPIIASKLLKIYTNNISKYNLILKLSNKIRRENNDSIYDQKMEIIIDYLLRNDITISDELDDKSLYNIETYILDQYQNNNLKYKSLNINNYVHQKSILLDEEIKICNDIDALKDLVYQKHFCLSKQLVDEFLLGFAYNWNSVINLCETDLINQYLNTLNIINNTSDVKTLKSILKNATQYTISDYFNIKSMMVNTYNKAISIDIKNFSKGKQNTIKINNNIISVEELSSNFGIFVHSTDAYGSMPLINNDYYESWNYNPNTKNHGICTSYITNSSYGTATVKNNGVMLGFTNITDNSVPIMAPYDLTTKNDGYTIKSRYKPFYARLKTISDYTRHTHNEISLERRVFNESGNSCLRQPDSIIIFEDMPLEIKENSIKAYEDFKKHGIELKIIYIDRVKTAKKEAIKLSILINEYEKNYNLELLAEIINIYECNICSCDFLGIKNKNSLKLFDQHELFKTEQITKLLFNTVEYIKKIEDLNTRQKTFNQFINILNNEQFKFNLINDFNKKRKHTFDLINENLKLELSNLEKTLSIDDQKRKLSV